MRLLLLIIAFACCALGCQATANRDPFTVGTAAYAAGDYETAVVAFREAASAGPAAGTLLNLGLAEWQRGAVGPAILAWERTRWVSPFDRHARNNLQFARTQAQLESPELTWYEVASTWLPANWWAWIVGGSLWFVVGMLTLPGVLRRRRTTWHQTLAAVGLGVLLLSLPAHLGVLTRAQLGFVLAKDVPLRLTPTADAEAVTRLAAGESARCLRRRGDYVFVRTNHATGWLHRTEFALVCAR